MIKHIIVCDVCGKEEYLFSDYRDIWFRESTNETICSQACFNRKYFSQIGEPNNCFGNKRP